MMTYTERYGNFWKMFVNEVYFPNSDRAIKMSKKRMLSLDSQFEAFLANLQDNLKIAG